MSLKPPTIDREATLPALIGTFPSALALASGRPRIAAGLLALPAALAAFFRDPDRACDRQPVPEDAVISPADGKVIHAGPAHPDASPEGEWQQISIFLSLFDVHINRAPYGGTVESVHYRPGNWLVAYRREAAFLNERSEIVVSREVDGQVRRYVFRQIVGVMARRVVTRIKPGDQVRTGQRIGLMKFGSRMDIFVPPGVELAVRTEDRVVAGETVLARWPVADGH